MASSITASSGITITTTAIDSTGADLLVVVTSGFVPNGVPVISSDSNGNTWQTDGPSNGVGNTYGFFYYVINPVVGSGHTVSLSGSRFYTTTVLAYSGSDKISNVHKQNSNNFLGVTASLSTNSITPSVNGCLIIAGTMAGGASWGTVTVDSSLVVQQQLADSINISDAAADYSQSGIAAINPTFSYSANATNPVALIAAFKPAIPIRLMGQILL